MKQSGFDGEGYAISSGRIGLSLLVILIAVFATLCKLAHQGGQA